MKCSSPYAGPFPLLAILARRYLLILILLSLQPTAWAAECACPQTCSPCTGGLVNLTLKFMGSAGLVSVRDVSTELFGNTLAEGEIFTVAGQLGDGRFRGVSLTLFVDGQQDVVIAVNCTSAVFVNQRLGSFLVIAGESKTGGALCCADGPFVDSVSPEFVSAAKDIFTEVSADCSAVVLWNEPEIRDCTDVSITQNYSSGSVFPLGQTVVTYTATDTQNNTTKWSFTITVADGTSPVIQNCPPDVEVDDASGAGVAVNWSIPLATDECGVISLSSTHEPGMIFPPGESEVRYTAKDYAGNQSVCSFKVVVRSVEPQLEHEILITPVVTPDGDGINDLFEIKNIGHYRNNKVTIIDRWGNHVYGAEGYDNQSVVWNGTRHNNEKLPSGTYFYSIVVYAASGRIEKRGFIELLN